MNLSLLIQLCGTPLFIILSVFSVSLTLFALVLYFKAKREALLAAFVPLTLLPAIAGLVSTLIGLVSSIAIELEPNSEMAVEPAFALQIRLVPLLVGVLAAAPPLVAASVGRWLLAYRESGVSLLPEPGGETESISARDEKVELEREADAYLERISRPR